MNLKQIEAFRATMSCRSVTTAAAQLNISQPSVSRLLADLERAVGFNLFIRRSKGVEPTEEAVHFSEEIERVYGALEHLDHVAQDIREGAHGSVTVGAIAAFALEVVPRALARLDLRQNSLSVRLRMRSSQRIVDWVRSGQLDLAVFHAGVDTSGVECLARRSAPYVCLIPKDHPLAAGDGPLPLSRLNRVRTIALAGETEAALRSQTGSRFARGPLVTEVSFPAAALAEQGAGIAVVDPFTAHRFTRTDLLSTRTLAGMKDYEFVVAAPIGRRRSRLVERLRELVIDEIDAMANTHS